MGPDVANRVRGVRLRDHLDRSAKTCREPASGASAQTFLAHQSVVMGDAIARTLVRLVSKRHHSSGNRRRHAARLKGMALVLRRIWVAPAMALCWRPWCSPAALEHVVGAALLVLWANSPYFAYQTGLPRQEDQQILEPLERREMRHTARLTWRFFEEVVTAGDNWLVPDNYQENRPDRIAHRTSPTNIGLQMMAVVSAWDLGYLSASECLTRLDRTVDTLHRLPRYRGHFFNWYDTQSLVPLAPLYVSTVDSGNFSAT